MNVHKTQLYDWIDRIEYLTTYDIVPMMLMPGNDLTMVER